MTFNFSIHYTIRWGYDDSCAVCNMLLRWGIDPFDKEKIDYVHYAIIRVIQEHCLISGRDVPEDVYIKIITDVQSIWTTQKRYYEEGRS